MAKILHIQICADLEMNVKQTKICSNLKHIPCYRPSSIKDPLTGFDVIFQDKLYMAYIYHINSCVDLEK